MQRPSRPKPKTPLAASTGRRQNACPVQLTEVGADFFEWADGGRTITWAVGSTFYRQSMPDIGLDQPASAVLPATAAKRGRRAMQTFEAVVELPRDTPRGALVLRGATAITMRGDEVIDDADVLIVDDHIAAVGPRGRVRLPPGAAVHDVSGRYILPGFIALNSNGIPGAVSRSWAWAMDMAGHGVVMGVPRRRSSGRRSACEFAGEQA